MTRLIEIREELGFTQELMAMYLKINISTLKMAETGFRELPTYALIRVAELEIKLAAQKKEDLYIDMHPSEKAGTGDFECGYQLMTLKEKKCDFELVLLEPKLEGMVANYRATRARLQLIETVLSENEGSEFDPGPWEDQLQTAIHVLQKCSLLKQVLLKSRIALLKAQIELFQKIQLQVREQLPDLFPRGEDEKI